MEQATNSFSKGIQLDTHPIVQGDDTLTDCLNGTLVTMQGNEIILQNDMGNRRVNNAFLPSGYQPVGMKEYGGIIYVAAYNPITNKSQIGSFPSPQKILDSNPASGGCEFNFNKFIDDSNIIDEKYADDKYLKYLKSDSFMFPLSENIFRAGDKFAIFANGLSSMENDLTNYNNIEDSKADSPKNRKYTLQVGILNSQNEFVDITKTLARWKPENETVWKLINYDSSASDIYKFNDGYFISDTFEEPKNSETIANESFIKQRQKLAVNTYSYKLAGPMYLKVKYNHIEDFNYNIYGIKTEKKENDTPTTEENIPTTEEENDTPKTYLTLWVEGFVTYNCPDGVVKEENDSNEEENNSNEDYYDFYEGVPTSFDVFDLISVDNSSTTNISEENPKPIYSKSVYNPISNLYSIKITKQYEVEIPEGQNEYKYKLLVSSGLKTEQDQKLYLKELTSEGIIDVSLIGSGTVSINGWRFKNNLNNRISTLNYSFNAYPKYQESFGNLKFIFIDIADSNNIEIEYPKEGGLPLYNGKQTEILDWDTIGLKPRKLYKVRIKYDTIDSTGKILDSNTIENIEENPIKWRWFLTTELFNDFYSTIDDFSITKDTDFLNKCQIQLSIDEKCINNSYLKPDISDGGLTSKTESVEGSNIPNITWDIKHEYHIDLNSPVNATINIANEDLYPDFINIEFTGGVLFDENSLIKIGDNIIKFGDTINGDKKSNINNYLKEQTKANSTDLDISLDLFDNTIEETVVNKKLEGDITFHDLYYAKSEKSATEIINAFDKFSNIINEIKPKNNASSYNGVIANYEERSGADDYHFIELIHGIQGGSNATVQQLTRGSNWVTLERKQDDGITGFIVSDYQGEIDSWFNEGIFSGQVFTYLYTQDSSNRISNNASRGLDYGSDSPLTGHTWGRIWWKNLQGGWSLISKLISPTSDSDTNFKDFILNTIIAHDYIYCMYDTYYITEDSDLKIYIPDSQFIYNKPYQIPITFDIRYIIPQGNSSLTGGDRLDNTNLQGKFIINNTLSNSEQITINLKSSQEFQDKINNLDPNSISNVDINTGLQVDSQGNPLNPNYIYYNPRQEANEYVHVRFCNVNPGQSDDIYATPYPSDYNPSNSENLRNFIGLKISTYQSSSSIASEYNPWRNSYSIQRDDDGKYPVGGRNIWIRYSESYRGAIKLSLANGTNTYIGICLATEDTAPTNWDSYSWVPFTTEYDNINAQCSIPLYIGKDVLYRTSKNLAINPEYKINGKNVLLYNGITPGVPEYRYNIAGGGDSHTYLDFNGINLVKDV